MPWKKHWLYQCMTGAVREPNVVQLIRSLTSRCWLMMDPPFRASDESIVLGRPSNLYNLYSVGGFVCVATPPYVWTDQEEWPMELSFSSRVMAQAVNAIVSRSEVPMPQFTATLRNLHFPPWHDSLIELVCSCIVWLLHLSVHVTFCLLLYSVSPYWSNQKWMTWWHGGVVGADFCQ